jgi:hypothetical protein
MPILGQGVLPSGAIGNELQAVTRRAFIPKVIVQLYKATPILSSLLAMAESITGGVSPITAPLQGAQMVTAVTSDYSGSFTGPVVQPGLQNAEFNLKAYLVPIPFYVMEGLVQIDASVIPILEARMNDAGNAITDKLSTDLWAAQSANSVQQIFSLNDIISTTNPTQANYGGIDRTVTANAFWKANVKTIASLGTAGTTWTRNNVVASILSATKSAGGEMPTFGVCGLGSWASLSSDYVGNERYVINPDRSFDQATEPQARAVFTALAVSGVPIYADPYVSENLLYLFNIQYIGFKIHADAAFTLAGPSDLLPRFQLGYIMVLVTLLEVVCTKPAAQTQITGFTGAYTL